MTPPSKDELNQARQAAIDAFIEADKAHRSYLALIEAARLDVDRKTQFLMRETMVEKPGRRIE